MTSTEKLNELMKFYYSIGLTTNQAVACVIKLCKEVTTTKNYPNTLHPEMTAFQNAYWEHIGDEALKLK